MGLYSKFVPDNSPLYTLWTSIYQNVTEEGLINFPKLAEKQKSQRAVKMKNRLIR